MHGKHARECLIYRRQARILPCVFSLAFGVIAFPTGALRRKRRDGSPQLPAHGVLWNVHGNASRRRSCSPGMYVCRWRGVGFGSVSQRPFPPAGLLGCELKALYGIATCAIQPPTLGSICSNHRVWLKCTVRVCRGCWVFRFEKVERNMYAVGSSHCGFLGLDGRRHKHERPPPRAQPLLLVPLLILVFLMASVESHLCCRILRKVSEQLCHPHWPNTSACFLLLRTDPSVLQGFELL